MSQLATDEERLAVGQRLAKIRQELCYSQVTMAAALGVALRTYQSYEQGVREVPGTIFRRLKKEFLIDPAWMLEGDSAGPAHRRAVLDEETWTKTYWAVEDALAEADVKLSPAKKFKIFQAVYAQALASGEVDKNNLATLVSIAA